MNVVTVVGARPQFIKAAAVSRIFAAAPGCRERLIHTGQHYDDDMSDVFFRELEIPAPDRHLGIGSGPHGRQTGRMLEAIEAVLLEDRPDWVLVYGDTNSTLAGALAAAKLHIPVAHVEAGLRSFNRRMPEEINRILTDHAANLLFAPTETAVANLHNEGIGSNTIVVSGDVMYDAALFFADRAACQSNILENLSLQPRAYALATVHRAENTDDPVRLRAIIEGLSSLAGDLPVVLPLHPRTRQALARDGLLALAEQKLLVIPPAGYLDMVMLERHARLVATDSGGVQKEAFFHGVPCATLRDETEWVELVDLGWNHLVPPATSTDVANGLRSALRAGPGRSAQPYGDGHAAERIVETLAGRSP